MHRRSAMSTAAVFSCAFGVLVSSARSQEVGLYFDENATICVAPIENFGPALKVRIYAFVAPGDTLNGAVLGLDLPSGFRVTNQEVPPKDQNTIEGDITSATGVDITLSPCVVGGAPVHLLSFDLQHLDSENPDARVEDLVLKLRGGTNVADSLNFVEPQLKFCPDDPIGGVPELVEATALMATLNCTGECPCTVTVRRRTWADFKRLYLEP